MGKKEVFVDPKLFVIAMLIFALSLFFLSVATDTNPVLVFIGLIPLLLYIFYFFISLKRDPDLDSKLLWISPIVFAFFFYILGEMAFPFIVEMDIEVLSVINVFIAYVMNFLFIITYRIPRKLRKPRKIKEKTQIVQIPFEVKKEEKIDYADEDKLSYYTTALEHLQSELEEYEEKQMLQQNDINKYKKILAHYNDKFNDYNEIITELRKNLYKYETDQSNKVSKEDLDYYKKIANYFHLKNKDYDKHFSNLKSELSKYKLALKINKDNFASKIRSIEDKCKAINFVIGRVYSNKHGGNPKIREVIRIDKDLYNSFSLITSDFQAKDAKRVFRILTRIMEKLALFEMSEEEVFSRGDILSKHNEKLIDILVRHDKDPVLTYYEDTKQVCIDLMNYLSQNYKF